MKVVIVGAGQVGSNIAGRLVEEGHDVHLIDRDASVLARARESLDVTAIRGHGSWPRVLERAGIADADMLVAVTDSDEINFVACSNAARLGKSEIIKIARVRESSYADSRLTEHEHYPVDLLINPERSTADKILGLLRYPEVTEIFEFADGIIELIGLTISPTSPLSGLRLMEMADRFIEVEFLVAAIHRGSEVIIPRGTDVLLPGDEVFLSVRTSEAESVLKAVGVAMAPMSRVLIFGGTPIGRFLAKDLSRRGLKPKLIEPDPDFARELAESLEQTVVLAGLPTDAALLEEENLAEMHAVISCTADDEMTVMSALLAQRMGAHRVITCTNRVDYKPLMKVVGLDVSFSPRILAVNSIMHFIRHGRVVAVRGIGDEHEAEALEFEAELGSDAVGTPIGDLKLPRGIMIAALVREGMVLIPHGNTQIEAGDHVLVVASTDVIDQVEHLVQRRLDRDG